MADHPNAAAYRAAFSASQGQDLEAFRDGLADDVVWHMIGGETVNGADAVVGSMSGLSHVDFSLDLHDVVSNDDHMVALMTASVSAGDKSLVYRTAEIYHVNDEGKVTERWAFSDDTKAITDFFNSLD